MWRRLVAMMRFDGLGSGGAGSAVKRNPLKARPAGSPLTEASFAPNPGNLRMFRPSAARPQSRRAAGGGAAWLRPERSGYGVGAGWWQLAEEMGFAVLAPEQKAVNNPNTCFDWFNPEDITRGQGEAASIAAMIRTMIETYQLDKGRVFITGLSAGGAMTAVMLATYPELFAGGGDHRGPAVRRRAECARCAGKHAQRAAAHAARMGRCGARGFALHGPLAEDLDLAWRAGYRS